MKHVKSIEVEGLFETARPVGGAITHKVNVELGEMFDDMAKFEVREMQRVTRYAQNVTLPTEKDMKRYMKTLVYIRVMRSTEAHKLKDLRQAVYSARVPARLSVLMDNIGIAYDHETNIKFIPVCEISSDDLMSMSEISEVSAQLAALLEDNYTTIKGISKSEDGSIMLMSKLVMSIPGNIETVLSYRRDNPVYAFFASLLNLQLLELTYEDLRLAYRVQYSEVDVYKFNLNEYYNSVPLPDEKQPVKAPEDVEA